MKIPHLPWYNAVEQSLEPAKPYATILLIGLAAVTIAIAVYGDNVMRIAWFVYMVSP